MPNRQKSMLELSAQSLAQNTNNQVRSYLELQSAAESNAIISASISAAYVPFANSVASISASQLTVLTNTASISAQQVAVAIDQYNLDLSTSVAIVSISGVANSALAVASSFLVGNQTISGDKNFLNSISGGVSIYSPRFDSPATSGNGMTLTGTFGWHDLVGDISIRGTGPSDPTYATYVGNIRQYQFSTGKEVFVTYHCPHDLVPNTDLHIHAHWSHNSAATSAGSVVWGFECAYSNGYNRGTFANTVTVSASQAASTQYAHRIAETQLTTGGGLLTNKQLETDGLILARIYLVSNTLSPATDPFLHTADLHYQSTSVCTKNKNFPFYS